MVKKFFWSPNFFGKKNKKKKNFGKKFFWERHLFFPKIFLESQLFSGKKILVKKNFVERHLFWKSATLIVAVGRGDKPPDQGLIVNAKDIATTNEALYIDMTCASPSTMHVQCIDSAAILAYVEFPC